MPVSGFFFGLCVSLVLLVFHHQPIATVKPPRWSHALIAGTMAAVAVGLLGLAAIRPAGVALATGLAVVLAMRRTMVHPSTIRFYRVALLLTAVALAGELVISWALRGHWVEVLGILAGALASLLVPVRKIMSGVTRRVYRLPTFGLRPTLTQNLNSLSGYAAEVLAFATFLAPQDIPRSLVIQIAITAKRKRVSSLDSLAPDAFTEAGPDSLNIDPLTQRLAFHRLSVAQRKEWAGRAVRELAGYFPADYASNPEWCERLAPHALAAAQHAIDLQTERGAAALLLNHVAGYFLLSGRAAESGEVLHVALACAGAAFGARSRQAAIIRANLFGSPFQTLNTPSKLPPGRHRMPESSMLAFGLSVIVGIAAIMVGSLLWREAYAGRPQPASTPLSAVGDLISLCTDPQLFFPDAAAASGTTHPVQLFFRESSASDYTSERLPSPVPAQWHATTATLSKVQLVGCVTRVRTGGVIATCTQPVGPEIKVHQASYDVEVFEARTGKRTATATINITAATCPSFSTTGRIFARPGLSHYQTAIGGLIG